MKGGNMIELYKGNGRLKMACALQKMWPQYVTVKYKFNRPQHSVRWDKFTTKLKRDPNLDWEKIREIKYNMTLNIIKDNLNDSLIKFYNENK